MILETPAGVLPTKDEWRTIWERVVKEVFLESDLESFHNRTVPSYDHEPHGGGS